MAKCKHKWRIIRETYAYPLAIESVERMDNFLLQRITLGATDVLLQCEICTETEIKQMVGKRV